MNHSSRIALLVMLVITITSRSPAQMELLPLDHPATEALVRIYEYGGIPEFPREHLPISRGLALELLSESVADQSLPDALRRHAEYYRIELASQIGDGPTAVFIPTGPDSRLIYSDPFAGDPVAVLDYTDTARSLHLVLDGFGDGDLRTDPSGDQTGVLFRWGFQLRGTLLRHVGFSSRISNGTIVGDTLIFLRDPMFAASGKLGVIGTGRDVDFGSGHARVDFDAVSFEVGRERLWLGAGGEGSLLVGSMLPSMYDYIRLGARIGRISFTHLHASLLADREGAARSGVEAMIPPKYLAAHAISFGPFAGIRGTIGESVIYSRRPFEIGYINPMNFIKSQEHYLRDRDNSNMYAAVSINPARGLFLEGEFLLDDLKFSEIGKGFWSNKTAWRVGGQLTATPFGWSDIGISYTRLEPYVYSHFDSINAYIHDGAMLGGSGLQPNSDMVEGRLRIVPLPNLRATFSAALQRHGANETGPLGEVVRNVGGDVRRTNFSSTDSPTVTFLDGRLEKTTRLRLEAEYEPLRNIYLRLVAIHSQTRSSIPIPDDTQIQFGLRVGVY